MWTYILIFGSITIASSRHVQNFENGDFVAILDDMFGVRHNREQNSGYNTEFYNGFNQDALFPEENRQGPAEPTEEYVNQQHVKQFHHHGHHRDSNGHVHCHHHQQHKHRQTIGSNEDSTENNHRSGNVNNRNVDTSTHSSINNTPKLKTDLNSTKTNAVTENINRNTFKTEVPKTLFELSSAKTTEVPKHREETPEERNFKDSRNTTVENGTSTVKTISSANGTDGDRWIWDNGTTTPKLTTVGLGDRAAFSGDGCPSSQVKVGNVCVDED